MEVKLRVLITGGAGFIGSCLARKLLDVRDEVSVLDNFSPQIRGGNTELAAALRDSTQLFRGDIREVGFCARALVGQQVLIHLAAETGTGQSMYKVRHYPEVNIGATAGLMELLLTGKFPVQNIVVASSRAVYGEGAAQCLEHGLDYPDAGSEPDMEAGGFE